MFHFFRARQRPREQHNDVRVLVGEITVCVPLEITPSLHFWFNPLLVKPSHFPLVVTQWSPPVNKTCPPPQQQNQSHHTSKPTAPSSATLFRTMVGIRWILGTAEGCVAHTSLTQKDVAMKNERIMPYLVGTAFTNISLKGPLYDSRGTSLLLSERLRGAWLAWQNVGIAQKVLLIH